MAAIPWFHNGDVESAIAAARAADKPLLVDFWHPTCLGCAKLFATTYREPRLVALLAERFVCVKYQTNTPNEWFRKLNGRFAHAWHPDIAVMDAHLFETRRFIGYLPAQDFAAQVLLGAGLLRLYHTKPADALADFLAASQGESSAVPEALYWAGVAAYRVRGMEALRTYWGELGSRFPGSDWAKRADCLDVEIPETGFSMSDPDSVRRRTSSAPVGSAAPSR